MIRACRANFAAQLCRCSRHSETQGETPILSVVRHAAPKARSVVFPFSKCPSSSPGTSCLAHMLSLLGQKHSPAEAFLSAWSASGARPYRAIRRRTRKRDVIRDCAW